MITSIFLSIAFLALANAGRLAFTKAARVITQKIIKATKGRKPVCVFAN